MLFVVVGTVVGVVVSDGVVSVTGVVLFFGVVIVVFDCSVSGVVGLLFAWLCCFVAMFVITDFWVGGVGRSVVVGVFVRAVVVWFANFAVLFVTAVIWFGVSKFVIAVLFVTAVVWFGVSKFVIVGVVV